jgi:hypothetical protein
LSTKGADQASNAAIKSRCAVHAVVEQLQPVEGAR